MSKSISADIAKLGTDMLEFTSRVETFKSPEEVLDRLHDVTSRNCQLNVLGAAMFPLQWGDWTGVEKDKNVFLHRSTPQGWWEEHMELSRAHPGPSFLFAQLSLAPYTMSELMRILEPLAIDRWPFDLALKYGIRDRLNCPVGGRWVVTFWSSKVLSQRLSEEARAILFLGAVFTAIRLQKLLGPQIGRIGKGAALTPRELAVLRHLSVGLQLKEVAKVLEIGDETVRSHIKKAQEKLGVRTSVHAVAQAIRRHLIP